MMRTVDIITKKRDGGALSPDEIRHIVLGCAAGTIPDYQVTAWLMAVYFRGMSFAELAALTKAMIHSGEVHNLSSIPCVKVDKHSTGGVGDKVSLALAPLVASAGVPVPMVAGRALGHTGGTLDKLESIPGFNVHLDARRLGDQIGRIGVAIIGQSESFVPADRKMYALRDVTGTVESIPLITASIMSKKIAAGIDALVMDVKTGNGAFMTESEDARRLALTLVAVGREVGLPVVAYLTDMSQPLGRAVGNAVEVLETVECLQGRGPDDLRELVLTLGAEMLLLGRVAQSVADARRKLSECLDQGKAIEKLAAMIAAQGGDARVIEDPMLLIPAGLREDAVVADRTGFVAAFDTRKIGLASMLLGGGRQTADDKIDHAVGLFIEKKLGEHVTDGEPLCRILYREPDRMKRARDVIAGAVTIADSAVLPPPLIKSRLDAGDLINGAVGGKENG